MMKPTIDDITYKRTLKGLEGVQKGKSPNFARIVWKRLKRDKFAMIGFYIVLSLFIISYLAPVLANNKPIIMLYEDRWYFPAVAELAPFKWIIRQPELKKLDFSVVKYDKSMALVMPPIPNSPYEIHLVEKLRPPSHKYLMGTDDLGRDVAARMIHGAGVSLKVGFVAVAIALFIGVLAGAMAGYYGGAVDMLTSRVIEIVMCFPFFFLILGVAAVVVFLWLIMSRFSRPL